MGLMQLDTEALTPAISCIRVHGEVDSSNVTQLKEAFDQIFAKGVFNVVLNMEKTRYVSSSGVGCIVAAYTTAVHSGGRIVFASAPLQVVEIFRVIGLGQILKFVRDEAAATAELG